MPKTAEHLSDYPAFRLTLGGLGSAPGDALSALESLLKANGLTVRNTDPKAGYMETYYADCRVCEWSEVAEAEGQLRGLVGDTLVVEWDFLTGDHWQG